MSEEQEQAGAVLPDVEHAIAAAREQKKIGALDAGAVALALQYAELIDRPSAKQAYAKAIRTVTDAVERSAEFMTPPNAAALMDAWDKLSSALAEHTVASDLGPKLFAVLTGLGLTPAGRAAKGAPAAGGGQVVPTPGTNPLHLVQGESDGRYGRAG